MPQHYLKTVVLTPHAAMQSRRPIRIPGNINGGCTACGNNCKCTVCTCACDGACDNQKASCALLLHAMSIVHAVTARFVWAANCCLNG